MTEQDTLQATLWRLADIWVGLADLLSVRAAEETYSDGAAKWLALSLEATFRAAELAKRAEAAGVAVADRPPLNHAAWTESLIARPGRD